VRGRQRRNAADPFAALGLAARPGLTDDEVRAAWRRVAAATHPDRADGGDPERFAEAAAAYTELRTTFGRGEAIADAGQRRDRRQGRARPGGATTSADKELTLAAGAGGGSSVLPRSSWRAPGGVARLASRVRRGRPGRLALRLLAVAAASAAAVAAAGSQPAVPALITGALTWLLLTARRDLAPPPGLPPAGWARPAADGRLPEGP
jgi:curved DNA-binding protein CbpA